MKIRYSFTIYLVFSFLISCNPPLENQKITKNDTLIPLKVMKKEVQKFAPFKLTSELSHLSANQKEMLKLFFQIADIMDELFWKQAYGDKEMILKSVNDEESAKQYIQINYGPWERLNNNAPFLSGIQEKPLGANFYPTDMTKEEFEAFSSKDKSSLYTIIRRNESGQLQSIPYHIFFKDELSTAAGLLNKASELAVDKGFKLYLQLRAKALLTGEYYDSDTAWMDMKTNPIDFVVGPIENYEDRLYGYKAAFEAYILLKDLEWSNKLKRYAKLLPELQKALPVPEDYKKEVPGEDSDLGAYDVVYYAGDCNAGSKTIAINLPNDEKVQNLKGSRKLQLKNAMQAKFDMILKPICNIVIDETQRKHVTFKAFFENTMFHEVAHGLGIKNTINNSGTVRHVLQEQYSALEEGKADILGLYLVTKLHEMKIIQDADLMDNYVTFMAGIFRSVRFGAASSHGKANMVRFNFFEEQGAFTKDIQNGTYTVNFEKMKKAMNELVQKILIIQGDGNYDAAKQLVQEKGTILSKLQSDLDAINAAGIPVDIRFIQGPGQLDL